MGTGTRILFAVWQGLALEAPVNHGASVRPSHFFMEQDMSNYSIWEANQQNFSWGTLEKTQAIGGGGGGRVMWQNEKSQNLGNHQCDLGQIAYFFSLGSLISKMETRKKQPPSQGGCEHSKYTISSFILDDILSSINLEVQEIVSIFEEFIVDNKILYL